MFPPVCLLLAVTLVAGSAPAADLLLPVDARQIRVGGEIGRRFEITLRNNLLVIDTGKDFLKPFEERKQKDGYIGLGKLILSAVRFAAYAHDPQVTAFKDRLIARTIALQQSDGYLGILAPAYRVKGMWDIHEMNYLAHGLLSDYEFFGSKPSLAAARGIADYILSHWSELPADWAEQTQVATHVAVTGLERTLLRLYRATGDARYLSFVVNQRALPQWNLPILIGRRPGIEGHIYAYMARTLAQLELYRMQPGPQLLANADRAIDFLAAHDGMAVSGGAGQMEIWTDDQDGRASLGETCATAYQIRVYDSLLRLRADPLYGDLMERTIYNALFAAQSPDGRRLRYYAPTEGPREYFALDTYCCPTNYRRIVAELPEMIYYRAGAGVAVNLYTASEAKIDLDGVTLAIRQETEYPSRGDVLLRIDPSRPARFPVQLRIPRWASGAAITVNGQPTREIARPGTFLTLDREWRPGDRVLLRMPMEFRLVRGRQRQAGRVAVLRGPLVFTLNPAGQKELEGRDAADLSLHVLVPKTLEAIPDASVHPGGIACRVSAWKPSMSLHTKPDLQIKLTEFADPGAQATYFRLRDFAPAVEDELLGRGSRQ